MARMWRGPSAAMKAAESDPLWASLHRRNACLGIFCNVTNDGRLASFYTISNQRGGPFQHDLGESSGDDPMLTVLHGSHTFTPFDAELMRLHHAYLERMSESIVLDGHSITRKLAQAVDAFVP
jgi:hypothetical protein